MPDRPSPGALAWIVARTALRGLLCNIVLVLVVAGVRLAPDFLVAPLARLGAAVSLFAASDDSSAQNVAWIGGVLIAAIVDMTLLFHPMHSAAEAFKASMHFCREMACKIFSLDTRGADAEKAWAKGMLEAAHLTSLGGYAVQLLLSPPLFLLASLGPWLAAAHYLRLGLPLYIWFVAIKMPGTVVALREAWCTAWATKAIYS